MEIKLGIRKCRYPRFRQRLIPPRPVNRSGSMAGSGVVIAWPSITSFFQPPLPLSFAGP